MTLTTALVWCVRVLPLSRPAVYGASDLTQANTVFLDSSFGMGYNLRELAQVGIGNGEGEGQGWGSGGWWPSPLVPHQ